MVSGVTRSGPERPAFVRIQLPASRDGTFATPSAATPSLAQGALPFDTICRIGESVPVLCGQVVLNASEVEAVSRTGIRKGNVLYTSATVYDAVDSAALGRRVNVVDPPARSPGLVLGF